LHLSIYLGNMPENTFIFFLGFYKKKYREGFIKGERNKTRGKNVEIYRSYFLY